MEEGQALALGLGCGAKGGAAESRKGVLRGNPWVGGGDGKIIPAAFVVRLATERGGWRSSFSGTSNS